MQMHTYDLEPTQDRYGGRQLLELVSKQVHQASGRSRYLLQLVDMVPHISEPNRLGPLSFGWITRGGATSVQRSEAFLFVFRHSSEGFVGESGRGIRQSVAGLSLVDGPIKPKALLMFY